MSPAPLWVESVGLLPHRVTVYENAEKSGVLYLRWRADGNWKKKSLGLLLRDSKGRPRADIKRMALAEAERRYEILTGKRPSAETPAAPLMLSETWAVISDPKTGLYPVQTRHTDEVGRSLAHAARIWGASTPWDSIGRAQIRMLGRTRIDEVRAKGKTGRRAAETTVGHVLTIAAWLRDESKIASDACLPPRQWKTDLADYWRQVAPTGASGKPQRPRHTIDEMRALLGKAGEVDPRFGLLMALGAELRLGQVRKCRRSDLSVEHKTLTVHDAGHKHGTVVELTAGQWAAWERAVAVGGYLSELEGTFPDYPLFPQGRLIGGLARAKHATHEPIDRTAIREWFDLAEQRAEIAHVSGRGAYGLRRVAVDVAKELGISREGLKQQGGWSDSHIPDAIYADTDAGYARKEASEIRAKLRGEQQ